MTEHEGKLAGKRVVRGREAECERYHAAHPEMVEAHPKDAPPPLDELLKLAARAAQRTHAD